MWLRMPLVPIALAFATGIALVDSLPLRALWPLAAVGLAAGAIALAVGRRGLAAAILLLAVAAVGALRAAPVPLPADHIAGLELPRPAVVTGRIGAEPTMLAPDRTRLILDVEAIDQTPRSGRMHVTLYGEAPALVEGQRVQMPTRLPRAAGFKNPGG